MAEPHHHAPTVPAVVTRSLYAAYDQSPVLVNINLSLPAGRLITVLGPNGAGKSTLLRILVGSMQPVSGHLEVLGESAEVQRKRSQIAYMPQQEQIDWDFPLSVRDVVLSGRYGRIRREGGWRRYLPPSLVASHHRDVVDQALKDTGMLEYRNRPIDSLSGGQRKRVLLARAIAQQAQLLLLDEPLVGVDRASEEMIREVLCAKRDQGCTVIMVTHDIVGAREDADHVVLINRTVVGEGDPETMLTDEMLSRTATVNWISQSEHREPEPGELAQVAGGER